MSKTARLDKLLGSLGYGSRAQIAQLARLGAITLDGQDLT
ncbi:MAG: 16S rRNA pseudouridine(516) synthase, partial [Brevundimonas sp.]